MKEYLINDKVYVDVIGAATILNKAIGTIRNRISMGNFPTHLKVGTKLYFEKADIEKLKVEVVEIFNNNKS